MTFRVNGLIWPIKRTRHSFRVYVVEPVSFDPSTHRAIFDAMCRMFVGVAPTVEVSSSAEHVWSATSRHHFDHFDLVTFPEAFLLKDDLIKILGSWSRFSDLTGCIHTGLCSHSDRHLFTVPELRDFLAALRSLPKIVACDLDPFDAWLAEPPDVNGSYNAGALFCNDAEGHLRICLHLKNVKSQYETSFTSEKHMTDAKLISWVVLRPVDRRMPPVVIQPLICADVLDLQTEAHPLGALNDNAGDLPLGIWPPDHVDIVSVATFTPQEGTETPEWRQEFRDTCLRAASGHTLCRHRHAVFVFSNFRTFPGNSSGRDQSSRIGGLSGVFFPSPQAPGGERDDGILWHIFAKFAERQRWMSVDDFDSQKRTGQGHILGHLVTLYATTTTPVAFGFTLESLPRYANRWTRTGTITNRGRYQVQL